MEETNLFHLVVLIWNEQTLEVLGLFKSFLGASMYESVSASAKGPALSGIQFLERSGQ
jgi:hypothetical protein